MSRSDEPEIVESSIEIRGNPDGSETVTILARTPAQALDYLRALVMELASAIEGSEERPSAQSTADNLKGIALAMGTVVDRLADQPNLSSVIVDALNCLDGSKTYVPKPTVGERAGLAAEILREGLR